MSRDRYAYAITEVTARPLVQRGLIAMLALTGVALLLLEHAQSPGVERLRLRMLDVVGPVQSVISQPVTAFREMTDSFRDYRNVMEENRRLRAENERLWHWQTAAASMKAENDALRTLMDYRPVEDASFVTARVIGQSPGGYSHSITINAGAAEGISNLQPVVDSYGLIGRVTEVGQHTSRVLLLSDPSSRIPVISSETHQHAILSGAGDDEMLQLTFLTADQQKIGLSETMMTTAEGNLIPGGIAVGQVFHSDGSGYRVKPVRSLTQAEYVRVIAQ